MRPIDADALLKWLSEWELQEAPWWGANGYGDAKVAETIKEAIDAVEQMPTIEPKRGKWGYAEVRRYPEGYNLAKCSCCGWTHYSRPGEKYILTAEDVATYFKYCPHCGARMEVNNLLKSE